MGEDAQSSNNEAAIDLVTDVSNTSYSSNNKPNSIKQLLPYSSGGSSENSNTSPESSAKASYVLTIGESDSSESTPPPTHKEEYKPK